MAAVKTRGVSGLCLGVVAIAACSSGGSKTAPTPATAASTTTTTISPTKGLIQNVDHLVVLMQENRSFDSYFGRLTPGDPSQQGNPNPVDKSAPPILPFNNPKMCETADLAHGWDAVHQQINGGKMDGFTATNVDPTDPTGSRAMARFGPSELPYYYGLARTFGIGDRYFSSVPGPTYPNRYYLIAGTSFGHVNNTIPSGNGWTQKTIFEELDAAHISWKIYNSLISVESLLFAYVRDHSKGHVVGIADYYADAAAGKLPNVSFLEPTFIGKVQEANDEHPPANPQLGQQFSAKVIGALMRSPNWSTSAFFQTWDEHGGSYDHVAPPKAPKPDDIAPIRNPGDAPAAFDQYGVRVPVLVVSPWSRPHYVSHVVHDHTSILRTIEIRFGLKALSRRDAAAAPMTDFFDFSHPAYATPPKLPVATIDPRGAAQCLALYKDKTLGI
jgi:phospholipase C